MQQKWKVFEILVTKCLNSFIYLTPTLLLSHGNLKHLTYHILIWYLLFLATTLIIGW